jgi:hypothetical protein
MIVSLAFVPDEKISFEYEKLFDYFLNCGADEEIINFLIWFEKVYIKPTNYLIKDEKEYSYNSWNIIFILKINYQRLQIVSKDGIGR